MRQEIKLFLGDREVEFNSTPQILYNWTQTDLQSPSVVKNSFTKSIAVDGTKTNCDTLGHFYDLSRYQDYGGSTGPGFNPLTKTDFTLYINGALYEKGYAKLNDVVRDGSGRLTFNLTLYGNLGNFFSKLTYQTDDDADAKLTLADLNYDYVEEGLENELKEWRLNKDEVWNAWGTVCGYGDTTSARYRMIQYVPTYNGKPDDFSSDKVLINYHNGLPSDIFTGLTTDNNTIYRTVNGYALGNYDGDLTPWTTFDLRSYLMTPAVRMRYLIDACKNPDLHGFELDLDPHFFNDSNPYYNNSWMTLGSFTSLGLAESSAETITATNVDLQRRSGARQGDLFNLVYTGGTLDRISNTNITLRVGFTPSDSTTATTLYTDTEYHYYGATRESYKSAGGCIVQLWAMNANDEIVATSNAYLLSSSKNKANTSDTPLWWNYYKTGELDMPTNYTWMDGCWKKKSGVFVFCDRSGNIVDLNFKLNTNVVYHHLVLKIKWPYSYYTRVKHQGIRGPGRPYYYPENDNMDNFYEVNPTGFPMYTVEEATGNTYHSIEDILVINRVRGAFNYSIRNLQITNEGYGNFLSNSILTKKGLLGGNDMDPASLLLSFSKAFGLYWYYDPSEEASDPEKAPNGVIHLMDRNSFFTEEVVDIDDKIDYSKNLTITPTAATSKWLSFNIQQTESQANSEYNEKYGCDYARQLVNTSYNYDLGTKEMYENTIFKGGVMVREKNALYAMGMASYGGEENVTYDFPIYIANNRFTYSLFDGDQSTELKVGGYLSTKGNNINTLGLNYYDSFPKLQLHGDDLSPSDGKGILLFLNGAFETNAQYKYWHVDHYETQNYPIYYWITDDVMEMASLNEDNPCYLLTFDEYNDAGARIARKINAVPNFTRDWINGGQQEGYITNSWNFGHPQETYVPNVFSTPGDSIYDKAFARYIRDIYDVNTRIVTCNVKFENITPGFLRKYYWFQNGLYRLNAVKDYNVNSFETTQCEFIKVQDPENYKLAPITTAGDYRLTLDTYEAPRTGATIGGTVYLQSGGRWYLGDVVKITYLNGTTFYDTATDYVSPTSGSGQTSTLEVTLPANTSAYTKYVTIYVEYEDYPHMEATIVQAASQSAPYLAFNDAVVDINAAGGTVTEGFIKQNMRSGLTASVSYTGQQTGWITGLTVNESTNQVTMTVLPNTGWNRSATITLSGTGTNGTTASTTFRVDQSYGGDLTIQPDHLTFGYLATSGDTIRVSYGGPWEITAEDQ